MICCPETVTNGTECYANFACKDTTCWPFTPTSLSYQVWDTTNGVQVVPPTDLAPVQSGSITITASQNVMNAASTQLEARTVTLKIGIPGGTFENVLANYTLKRGAGTP